jgi:uncharacterized protein with PQ loop repeat
MFIDLHAVLLCFEGLPGEVDWADLLQYSSWSGYLVIGILYSLLLFFGEIPKAKRAIFSKQNKMNLTQILLIHISFLALLFLAFRVSSHVVRYLPPWITNAYDLGEGKMSIANLLFLIGALLLGACERIWLLSGVTESESVEK